MKKINIKLNEGLDELKFGCSIDEAIKLWGEPDEIENLNFDEDCNTTVLIYDNYGCALYFEESDQFLLSCIEIENEDAVLFDERIFTFDQKEIIEMMKKHGYTDLEEDQETWGENRISYEKSMIDFFFQDRDLISVTWGVII